MTATATTEQRIYHDELTARDQWVLWRYETRDGKPTKVPYNARSTSRRAAATLPGTWAPFAVALRAWQASREDNGIGYVFAVDDPYVGVDLDHCRDAETGAIDDWAHAIMRDLDGYAELSPSGTGVHIWVRGSMKGERRVGYVDGHKIEMYPDERFFTVTGLPVAPISGAIPERQSELDALYDQLFPPKAPTDQHRPRTEQGGSRDDHVISASAGDLTDDQILTLVADARNAPKFGRLWTGDTSDYADDNSRAEAGLAGILAFYTDDPGQIERLMRQSGLARDKWDRHRTYLDRTIQGAIAVVGERYARSIPVILAPASAPTMPCHHETAPTIPERETVEGLDLVAALDQARARIAELERETARIPALETENAALRAENAELVGLQRRNAAAMRNKAMKALAPVAIPLTHTIAAARRANPTETGPVRIYLPDLAHAAGRSPSTISRALVELADYGLIDRQEETVSTFRNDDRTREMVPCAVVRVSVDLKGTPEEFLEKIATFTPTKAPHGGYGIRCKDHPHANVVERHTCERICEECGTILSRKVQERMVPPDETAPEVEPDVIPTAAMPFHHDRAQRTNDDGATPGVSEPAETAMHHRVVSLPVAVCKPSLKDDLTPSVLAPACPECKTPAERQGDFVDDDGRGRFLCPACVKANPQTMTFFAPLRATIPGRERVDHQIARLSTHANMPLPLSDTDRSHLGVFQ